ncbi:MAG: MBL fold metallo-hydrolase [Spirochaetales bacterium]|nr:MBL fold metallo-hydrolase [Spirochaetales bacterium]
MKIQFFGAVRTVTGSQHMLRINGKNILLDCGLVQGHRMESYRRNIDLPFAAEEVDLCILSHAHIDHSGNLPNLVKNGFRGDIVCTYATRDLCMLMLKDSAHIQESDIEYVNKEREKNGEELLTPIYTTEDAIESLKYFLALAYNRPREIMPGVTLTFFDAGHILGSAIVVLDIEDREEKKDVRLVFSGDLGRPDRPILRDPTVIEKADVLIMESTYGDREHEAGDIASEKLESIINSTCKNGGKVIVPAFAVGRTQELVYSLRELVRQKKISGRLPVYVDSPLAIDTTGIYRLHPEAFDDEAYQVLIDDRQGDPFGFEMMHYTRTVAESKTLNRLEEPAVIISASGMAEAGRILHHLKNNVEDPANTILIVGWQAPYTLGKRLVEREPEVRILGREYSLKARVEKINGFSAHADRKEMLAWVDGFRQLPAETYIVHGDEDASLAFAESLRGHGMKKVVVPHIGDTVTI